jgi:hypothetical protein
MAPARWILSMTIAPPMNYSKCRASIMVARCVQMSGSTLIPTVTCNICKRALLVDQHNRQPGKHAIVFENCVVHSIASNATGSGLFSFVVHGLLNCFNCCVIPTYPLRQTLQLARRISGISSITAPELESDSFLSRIRGAPGYHHLVQCNAPLGTPSQSGRSSGGNDFNCTKTL